MRLVCKSAGKRNVAERLAARQHHFLRALDPQAREVCMRRFAESLLKGPAEMRRTQGDDLGESIESDGLLQVLGDIGFDPPLLPGRQTAASKGGYRGPNLASTKDRRKAS